MQTYYSYITILIYPSVLWITCTWMYVYIGSVGRQRCVGFIGAWKEFAHSSYKRIWRGCWSASERGKISQCSQVSFTASVEAKHATVDGWIKRQKLSWWISPTNSGWVYTTLNYTCMHDMHDMNWMTVSLGLYISLEVVIWMGDSSGQAVWPVPIMWQRREGLLNIVMDLLPLTITGYT